MNLENICLDLDKVSEIKHKRDRERIYNFYQDMLHHFQDGRRSMGQSIYNTLNRAGYIIDIRDEKIEKVLEADANKV
jgi:hypothetical protein